MRVWAPCLFVTVWFLFLLLHLAAESARIRLDIMPSATVRPISEWHLRAWIDSDDFNRTLRVEAHSADYDRSTDVPLNGSFAPRVHDVWWRGAVPCGTYSVTASVLGPSSQLLGQARKQASICVATEGQ